MILNGKLAAAPIDQPRHVLDIGTGTGIWAIDFAEQYPTSLVTGTDLSIIQGQPRTGNCQFVLENSETQDWMYPFELDYIHLRSTGPCFKDIGLLLQRAFNHMSPGGWIEFQDGGWEIVRHDNNGRESAYEYWLQLVKAGAAAAGHDLAKMSHYDDYLCQAGFTEIRKQTIWVPLTPWAKGRKMQRLGQYIGTTMTDVVDSFRKYLVLAGLPPQEIDELSAAVKRDLRDTSFQFAVPT
jgi:trans-aconitate methyltransferase